MFDNRGQKIGIFVIAFNAASHIQQTLKRIPSDIWSGIEVVYIIDDCSTDETVAKARELLGEYERIEVIRNPVNRRYGGNQKLGYNYALDRSLDVVVMLHADGQYAPESLETLLDPILTGEADLVLGSRMMHRGGALAGGMPRYKYFGNRILTGIQNRLGGLSLSEFHSGYRAYRTAFLRSIPFWENSDEWHFDSQILLQAKQINARIREVPIPTYYGNEICHVNGILYGLNCLATSLGFWLHRHGLVYLRIYGMDSGKGRYVSKFNDPFSSHSIIWEHLEKLELNKLSILELGVGDAHLTRRLCEAGARIDVIENDRDMAGTAAQSCRQAWLWDLNQLSALDIPETYDVVIAADVLEHLVQPEMVLAELKKYLKKGGHLIVSLPNIANFTVRLSLLFGRFNVHHRGILDESHLHHYTFRSMKMLLRKTGWEIRKTAVTNIPIPSVLPIFARLPLKLLLFPLHGLTRIMRGWFGYQGVFFCTNPNELLPRKT